MIPCHPSSRETVTDISIMRRQCNAGYYKSAGTCVSCRLTAGKYSLGGESACSSCSVGKKPGTAVFILPSIAAGGFDATSDNCPW